jgi:hypothetical protein
VIKCPVKEEEEKTKLFIPLPSFFIFFRRMKGPRKDFAGRK